MEFEQKRANLVALHPDDSVDIGTTLRQIIGEILAKKAAREDFATQIVFDDANQRIAIRGIAKAPTSAHPFAALDQDMQKALRRLHGEYPGAQYSHIPAQSTLTSNGVFALHGIIMPVMPEVKLIDILPSESALPSNLKVTDQKISLVQIATDIALYQEGHAKTIHEDEYGSLAIVSLPEKIRKAVATVLLQLV